MDQSKGLYRIIVRDLECHLDLSLSCGRVLLFELKSTIVQNKKERDTLIKNAVTKWLYGEGVKIIPGAYGEPILNGINDLYVSLSHAKNFYAFYFSQVDGIGIDVELDREFKKESLGYYMNESELSKKWSSEELITIWCAKESYLKMKKGKNGNWKEDISIDSMGHSRVLADTKDGYLTFNRIRQNNITIVFSSLVQNNSSRQI